MTWRLLSHLLRSGHQKYLLHVLHAKFRIQSKNCMLIQTRGNNHEILKRPTGHSFTGRSHQLFPIFTMKTTKSNRWPNSNILRLFSINHHLDYIKSKINKNIVVYKRLNSSRMLSQEISYRLYHAYIRPS
jgi:hypothetical protein